MKLLFLTYQGGAAGSTYSISYLARGLAQRGHEVYVGCREEVLLYELLQDTPVHLIPMHFRSKLDRQNMQHIREVVEQKGIELINPQSSKDRYTAILAKKRFGLKCKIVLTRRQTSKSSGWLSSWFYTWGSDKVVAVSEGVKASLQQDGMPESHLKVIPNGTPSAKYQHIDPQLTAQLKAQLGLKDEMPVIGCVSRKKQQEQLLEALTLLPYPVQVVFIGVEKREAYLPFIEQFSQPHELHFLPHVPGKEVLHYYPLFDMNVLPSVTEGLSQALLEAMALGVPVVATEAAGNPDLIVHGKNGLMFEPGNVAQLAGQVQELLADEALRSRLSKAGKVTALHDFSIERTLDRYEQFFRELLKMS